MIDERLRGIHHFITANSPSHSSPPRTLRSVMKRPVAPPPLSSPTAVSTIPMPTTLPSRPPRSRMRAAAVMPGQPQPRRQLVLGGGNSEMRSGPSPGPSTNNLALSTDSPSGSESDSLPSHVNAIYTKSAITSQTASSSKDGGYLARGRKRSEPVPPNRPVISMGTAGMDTLTIPLPPPPSSSPQTLYALRSRAESSPGGPLSEIGRAFLVPMSNANTPISPSFGGKASDIRNRILIERGGRL